MIKASLVVMATLTVLIAMGLRWREQRVGTPAKRPPQDLIARGKRGLNRWINAAALAAVATILILGGLHWLRLLQG